MLTSPRREKKSRDLLGCLGCEGDKARKCSRSLQIPTFCFVVKCYTTKQKVGIWRDLRGGSEGI